MEQELKVGEIEQINIRQNLINNKQQEMQRLNLEAQIISSDLKTYYSKLILDYKMDSKKKYRFNGKSLIEAPKEETKKEDVQSNKKV